MTSNDPRRAPGRLLTAADHAAAEAFRPDAGQLIGHAVGVAVANANQQTLPGALAQAIWQVHPPRMCARCVAAYNDWEQANKEAVTAAIGAAVSAAGGPGKMPDFRPHLPEELRHLVPNVERSITAVGGTELCKGHAAEALADEIALAEATA